MKIVSLIRLLFWDAGGAAIAGTDKSRLICLGYEVKRRLTRAIFWHRPLPRKYAAPRADVEAKIERWLTEREADPRRIRKGRIPFLPVRL